MYNTGLQHKRLTKIAARNTGIQLYLQTQSFHSYQYHEKLTRKSLYLGGNCFKLLGKSDFWNIFIGFRGAAVANGTPLPVITDLPELGSSFKIGVDSFQSAELNVLY